MADRIHPGPLYMVQLALLDSAGYATGQEVDWAADETSGALVLEGGRLARFTKDNVQSDPIEEANSVVGQWITGGDMITRVDIELSDIDPDLDALIGSTTVSDTSPSTYYEFWVDEELMAKRPSLCAILSQRSQGPDGTDDVYQFAHMMILACKGFISTPPEMPLRGPATRVLSLVPVKTNRTPLGISVDNMGLGTSKNRVSHVMLKSGQEYPVHLMSYQKDGVETTFTTTYKPVSSSIDSSAGANLMTDDGDVTDGSSFSTSTGVYTLAAAGSTGEKVELLYEHDEELTS